MSRIETMPALKITKDHNNTSSCVSDQLILVDLKRTKGTNSPSSGKLLEVITKTHKDSKNNEKNEKYSLRLYNLSDRVIFDDNGKNVDEILSKKSAKNKLNIPPLMHSFYKPKGSLTNLDKGKEKNSEKNSKEKVMLLPELNNYTKKRLLSDDNTATTPNNKEGDWRVRNKGEMMSNKNNGKRPIKQKNEVFCSDVDLKKEAVEPPLLDFKNSNEISEKLDGYLNEDLNNALYGFKYFQPEPISSDVSSPKMKSEVHSSSITPNRILKKKSVKNKSKIFGSNSKTEMVPTQEDEYDADAKPNFKIYEGLKKKISGDRIIQDNEAYLFQVHPANNLMEEKLKLNEIQLNPKPKIEIEDMSLIKKENTLNILVNSITNSYREYKKLYTKYNYTLSSGKIENFNKSKSEIHKSSPKLIDFDKTDQNLFNFLKTSRPFIQKNSDSLPTESSRDLIKNTKNDKSHEMLINTNNVIQPPYFQLKSTSPIEKYKLSLADEIQPNDSPTLSQNNKANPLKPQSVSQVFKPFLDINNTTGQIFSPKSFKNFYQRYEYNRQEAKEFRKTHENKLKKYTSKPFFLK